MYQWEGRNGDKIGTAVQSQRQRETRFILEEMLFLRENPVLECAGSREELRLLLGALCFLLLGPGFCFTKSSALLSPVLSAQTPRAAES